MVFFRGVRTGFAFGAGSSGMAVGACGAQVVGARHHGLAGLRWLPACLAGDAATGVRRALVLLQAGGVLRRGDLARGQLGQGGEDELGLALGVVAQVLAFRPFWLCAAPPTGPPIPGG